MAKISEENFHRLEKTIEFYERAIEHYPEFCKTEQLKPRTKARLNERLKQLKREAQLAKPE